MIAGSSDSPELSAAIETARNTGGEFVFLLNCQKNIHGIESALRALALETGRQFLAESVDPIETLAPRQAAAQAKLPAISKGDDAAFLASLADIAAGKVNVS
jgi:hypothetical protein